MTFKVIVCISLIAGCGINQCQGQINDGHYDEEDDAKVLPIVLPIVLIVAFVCIFACCWQGKKCPCNKEKDKKDNKPEKSDSKTGDTLIITNEKQATKDINPSNPTTKSSAPPSYATITGTRNKPLPGNRISGERHSNRSRLDDYPPAQIDARNPAYKREENQRYKSHGSESGRSHSSYSKNNLNRNSRRHGDEYSTNSRREHPRRVPR